MPRTKNATSTTVEELLRSYPPEVQKWARALRKLIRRAAPEADERANPGWRVISYAQDKEAHFKTMFCAICPLRAGANLGLYWGAKLPDPEGLLEGTGKRARHVKVRSAGDFHPAAFEKLVKTAAKLRIA